ncbi:hypothetical protein THRCLA_06919 [Thraustotheca clavata]|uniref:Uncharacterized protein n=1 Tax=Thraustotheca clavata TaxID=74557 RepID=A0A1V9ZHP7_9STRA|nr:hypothetical protein THRCLA_06919 [Thraustotheca clavata]
MENDLVQFLHNVESSAKKILKDHTKRVHLEAARDRVEKARKAESGAKSISRDELKAKYGHSVLIVNAPETSQDLVMPAITSSTTTTNAPVHPVDTTKDPFVLPALRKQELKEKAMTKIMQSPLYKGLKQNTIKNALQQLNAVEDLRTLGFNSSPKRDTIVHEHSTERRMCNACWADPMKRTKCEHSLHSNPRDMIELQGATSWAIDDLYVKYRGEKEREAAWNASCALQEASESLVIPILERHPLYVKYFYTLDHDNQYVQTLSRAKNKTKQFLLNVHTVWLTNLDHFNEVYHLNSNISKGLKNRLDINTIHNGFSQIQSVSAACALQHTADIANSPLFANNSMISATTQEQTMVASVKKIFSPSPVDDNGFVSLSLLACGRMEFLGKVPGTVPLTQHIGLWWCNLQTTRPAAMYLRDAKLSSSDTILVRLTLALDSAVLAPRWFAWIPGSVAAAVEREIFMLFYIPRLVVQLITMPYLESPLDYYLPSPVEIVNGWAEQFPRQPEFNNINFRQWLRYATIEPNFNLDAKAYGLKGGYLNQTGLSGRFSWHSDDAVFADNLIRPRLEKDFVVLGVNLRACGSNDPNMYTLQMNHEAIDSIKTSGLHVFMAAKQRQLEEERLRQQMLEIETKLQAGRLVLDAKRAEKRRLESEALVQKERRHKQLDGKAAVEEATIQEWHDRVVDSIVLKEWNGWEERRHKATNTIFYHHVNPELENGNSWTPPLGWPLDDEQPIEYEPLSRPSTAASVQSTIEEIKSVEDELDNMAKNLTENELFLDLLREKLGLSINQGKRKKHVDEEASSSGDESNEEDDDEGIAAKVLRSLEREESIQEVSSMSIKRLTRLHITRETSPNQPIRPGEGWKRLNVAKLPKSFAKKVYEPSIAIPPSISCGLPNLPLIVGIIDPSKTGTYEQPNHVPDFREHFISSLDSEMILINKLLRSHAQRNKETSISDVFKDADLEQEDNEPSPTEADKIQKAVLYTRNNNIKELENMFDLGVNINARDDNGNSLFILACQQGNKSMCKFLMRRRCDLNLQNFRGNTGLHYCYEYKWTELAEYLKEKGAKDDIPNAEGLMCYEGISKDNLAQL